MGQWNAGPVGQQMPAAPHWQKKGFSSVVENFAQLLKIMQNYPLSRACVSTYLLNRHTRQIPPLIPSLLQSLMSINP